MSNERYMDDETLRQIQLFRYVDFDAVRGLIDTCMTVTLQAEEILLTPGDMNSTVYLLVSGRLRVHLNSLDDEPIMIGEGESVGEMSVIDHQPVSAYVVADEPCVLLAMNEEALWSLVRSSHAAACNLLFTLTGRLRSTDKLINGDNLALEDVYSHYCSVDALTGLHSRYWIDNMFARLFSRSLNNSEPMSVILIDIDKFTQFNELYGSTQGDRILYYMAHTLTANLLPTEIIARSGDDEFLVLLPGWGIDNARLVAERLLNAVVNTVPAMPDGTVMPHPTISVGIAQMQPEQTIDQLIAAAEDALSRARMIGGNSISE
ncbi:MAG: GGDEF domain-containing protein [Deltaproteobacteria bacterium]|nr:GGDEF domain-containing protein [Deltaproteobacteria bacterium]